MRLLSQIKTFLVPGGKRKRKLHVGLLRGLRYCVDLKSDFQIYTGLAEVELNRYFKRFSTYIPHSERVDSRLNQ
jgi:hypothetical protein